MDKYVTLQGGLNEIDQGVDASPGVLIRAKNVECKRSVGYRSIKGYEKFDSTVVPGEGDILGVWRYGNKVYAFRNAVGGATAVMYESAGSGWTSKKTGLTPDGKYRFANANIGGVQKMYLASGVHLAAEWDGTTWTDVTTGMTPDTPTHVIGHKGHLFLSFGPSVQASPVGAPTGVWSLVTGTTEILTESDVTGFMQLPDGTLGIFSRNSTNILAGSVTADWVLSSKREYGNSMGCIEDSLQQMGSRTLYMDDRGVTEFYTSDKSGDFSDATLTEMIETTLASKKTAVVGSVVVKAKTQYRLFFSDGTGITATFYKDKLKGWGPFTLPLVVKSICNGEDANGAEVIHFGSTDGYIYSLESSLAFDGAAIESYMVTIPTHLGSPYHEKRFKRTQVDIQSSGVVTIQGKNVYPLRTGLSQSYQNMDIDGVLGNPLGEAILGEVVLGETDLMSGVLDTPGGGAYVSTYLYSNSVQGQWEIDGLNYQFEFGRKKRR